MCLNAARIDEDPSASTIGQLALQVVQELTQFINVDNDDNNDNAIVNIGSKGTVGNGKMKKKSAKL